MYDDGRGENGRQWVHSDAGHNAMHPRNKVQNYINKIGLKSVIFSSADGDIKFTVLVDANE